MNLVGVANIRHILNIQLGVLILPVNCSNTQPYVCDLGFGFVSLRVF